MCMELPKLAEKRWLKLGGYFGQESCVSLLQGLSALLDAARRGLPPLKIHSTWASADSLVVWMDSDKEGAGGTNKQLELSLLILFVEGKAATSVQSISA